MWKNVEGVEKRLTVKKQPKKIIEYAEGNRNATARGIAKNDEINKNGLSHQNDWKNFE